MTRKKAAVRKTKKATTAPPSSQRNWLVPVLVVAAVLGLIILKPHLTDTKPKNQDTTTSRQQLFDFGNQRILLNEQEVTLKNGSYNHSDPEMGTHEANIMTTSINPAGNRAAAILIDAPGGSGVFVYVIGAMIKDGKQTYSSPVLLGDRIKVMSLKVADPEAEDNGEIVVEYLDRPTDAPMSVDPTEKKTTTFAFQDDGNLIAVLE